jgi:hypothetical protein
MLIKQLIIHGAGVEIKILNAKRVQVENGGA